MMKNQLIALVLMTDHVREESNLLLPVRILRSILLSRDRHWRKQHDAFAERRNTTDPDSLFQTQLATSPNHARLDESFRHFFVLLLVLWAVEAVQNVVAHRLGGLRRLRKLRGLRELRGLRKLRGLRGLRELRKLRKLRRLRRLSGLFLRTPRIRGGVVRNSQGAEIYLAPRSEAYRPDRR